MNVSNVILCVSDPILLYRIVKNISTKEYWLGSDVTFLVCLVAFLLFFNKTFFFSIKRHKIRGGKVGIVLTLENYTK